MIFETERASYKVMLVARLPRPDPPITDRDCMPPGPALLRRLARQVVPRTRIRDCCWHHRIDWRQASAAAVAIARQVNRERITGEEEIAYRAYELVRAAGLPEPQDEAVHTLLSPADGITRDYLAGDRWRLSYMNGRKRSHVMLESGVRRTVVIRWR